MANQQLLDYVRQQVSAGTPKETIQQALVGQGWKVEDVTEAFAALNPTPAPAMPIAPTVAPAPKKSHAFPITLIVILLLVLVAGAAVFFVPSLNAMVMNLIVPPAAPMEIPYTPPTTTATTTTPTKIATSSVGKLTAAGEGWTRYTNPETNFSFAYPSNWSVEERIFAEKQPEGSVAWVDVGGDGVGIQFFAIGKEYPGGVTTKTIHYTVSGKDVSGYEDADKDGTGFFQGLPVCGGNLFISSESNSKTVTDKIIASLQCPK